MGFRTVSGDGRGTWYFGVNEWLLEKLSKETATHVFVKPTVLYCPAFAHQARQVAQRVARASQAAHVDLLVVLKRPLVLPVPPWR